VGYSPPEVLTISVIGVIQSLLACASVNWSSFGRRIIWTRVSTSKKKCANGQYLRRRKIPSSYL